MFYVFSSEKKRISSVFSPFERILSIGGLLSPLRRCLSFEGLIRATIGVPESKKFVS